ncbi:MAG: inorganic diphosphatase [Robiginitomaculum sp.]|nr:MAG: inorganic diphosphatase [Robiginitomaculum sp.]
MDINAISAGKAPPWDVNAIIEIPLGGVPVKYEVDKASGALFVDRFLHTAMFYPGNYGFIPHTLSLDGDPIDVMVVGRTPVIAGCVMRVRPVGMLQMEDESGPDEKILAVPVSKLHPYYESVRTYKDLPEVMCDQIKHFFTHYKDLEHEKWVKVGEWQDADTAAKAVMEAVARVSARVSD